MKRGGRKRAWERWFVLAAIVLGVIDTGGGPVYAEDREIRLAEYLVWDYRQMEGRSARATSDLMTVQRSRREIARESLVYTPLAFNMVTLGNDGPEYTYFRGGVHGMKAGPARVGLMVESFGSQSVKSVQGKHELDLYYIDAELSVEFLGLAEVYFGLGRLPSRHRADDSAAWQSTERNRDRVMFGGSLDLGAFPAVREWPIAVPELTGRAYLDDGMELQGFNAGFGFDLYGPSVLGNDVVYLGAGYSTVREIPFGSVTANLSGYTPGGRMYFPLPLGLEWSGDLDPFHTTSAFVGIELLPLMMMRYTGLSYGEILARSQEYPWSGAIDSPMTVRFSLAVGMDYYKPAEDLRETFPGLQYEEPWTPMVKLAFFQEVFQTLVASIGAHVDIGYPFRELAGDNNDSFRYGVTLTAAISDRIRE